MEQDQRPFPCPIFCTRVSCAGNVDRVDMRSLCRHLANLIFESLVRLWKRLVRWRVRSGKNRVDVARYEAARSRETVGLEDFDRMGFPEDLSA